MSIQLTSSFKKHLLKASQGLSLIELLVTLAIVTILLAVGLPSFNRMIEKNRVETVAYDLMTAIQTTRNLAVTKHQRAVLKARQEWQGWDIFIDSNDNGIIDADELLLFVQDELDDVQITSISQKMKTISFINTGESRQANGSDGGSFLAGTLQICGKNNQKGFKLILARGGRTRIAAADCN